MDTVNLGTTGTKVSHICLGCMSFGAGMDWMIDEAASQPLVRRAIEGGINFFDTADIYSRGLSEEILGRALKEFGPARDRTVIATKVFHAMGDDPNQRGLSRKHIMHAIDASLRRLGTDYVDLYQIHRFDHATPIEETLQALDDVVKAGKALYVGASSMWAWQFGRMLHAAERNGLAKFVTMQNQYNLLYREEEREMNPLCRAEGVGLIPWSPLAGGLLVGSRKAGTIRSQGPMARDRYHRPEDVKVIDTLAGLAEQRGESAAALAIAWLLSKPVVTAPIVGVTKMHHLDDAIRGAEIKLSAEEIKLLEAPYLTQPISGHQ